MNDGFVLPGDALGGDFELEQDVKAGQITAYAAPSWFSDTLVAERNTDGARHGREQLSAIFNPQDDEGEG